MPRWPMKTWTWAAVGSLTIFSVTCVAFGGAGGSGDFAAVAFHIAVSASIFFVISSVLKSPTSTTIVLFGTNAAAWNALQSAAVSFATTSFLPSDDRPYGCLP